MRFFGEGRTDEADLFCPARSGWRAAAQFSADVRRLHRACPRGEIPRQRLFCGRGTHPCQPPGGRRAGHLLRAARRRRGRGPPARDPGEGRLRGCVCHRAGKAAPPCGAPHAELPAGYAGQRLCCLDGSAGRKPGLPPGEPDRQRHQRPCAGGKERLRGPAAGPECGKALRRHRRRGASSRRRGHRRPHRPTGGEHHRPVRDAGGQAQPHGVYHIRSGSRPQPCRLCTGDGPDPSNSGPLRLHRAPAGRG